MARPEKIAVVDEIRTKLAEADAAVLTEYRGLTVPELAALRASLRGSDTEYKVFKNTLARRAVADSGLDGVAVDVRGPGGHRLRARRRGERGQGAARLRPQQPGARPEGRPARQRVITPVDIEALAELPSRDVLLAQVAGAFQAPLAKAAGLFQAFTRNFAYGVKALIDQRGGVPEEAAEAPRSRSTRDRSTARPKRRRRPKRRSRAEADAPPRPKPRRSRKRRQTPRLRQPTRPHQNPNRLSPSNRRTATWQP